MPNKFDKMKIANKENDKRVKLTDEQKENIKSDYKTGLFSQRTLASKYNVSRRTITFILDPEKLKRQKELFKERQKDGRYYDKDKQREYMQKHRKHKKELYKKDLLI